MTKFTRHTIKLEKAAEKKEKATKRFRFVSLNLKLVIIGMAILMGFTYLVQVNKVSTTGFEIQELEQRAAELKKENTKLELEAARLESLANIEQKVQELNLVSTEKVDYLEIRDSQVAQK